MYFKCWKRALNLTFTSVDVFSLTFLDVQVHLHTCYIFSFFFCWLCQQTCLCWNSINGLSWCMGICSGVWELGRKCFIWLWWFQWLQTMISLVDKWTAVHLLLLHSICSLWKCGHYLIFARVRLVLGFTWGSCCITWLYWIVECFL